MLARWPADAPDAAKIVDPLYFQYLKESLGEPLCDEAEMRDKVVRHLLQDRVMLFWQKQHMTRAGRIDVKNREDLIVLKDLLRRDLARDHPAEDALLLLELF